MALLEVKGMGISFGGLRAVNGYHLSIDPGQIVGLIGPNGAGKTTIFNLITGIYRPSDGEVLLEGRSIVGLAPHRIAASGLGRTFQEMKLWRHMSVLEHLKLAMYSRIDYGLAGAFFTLQSVGAFEPGMTAGRGFIAIALVIFSRWHPLRAIVGALLFSGAVAFQLLLQSSGVQISPFLLDTIPYVLTLLVLIAWGGNRKQSAPASLGRVYHGTE